MKKTIKLSPRGLRNIIESVVREEAQLASEKLHPAWDIDVELGTTAEDGPEDAHVDFGSAPSPILPSSQVGGDMQKYSSEFNSKCGCGGSSLPTYSEPSLPIPEPTGFEDFDVLTLTTVEDGDEEENLLTDEPEHELDEKKGEWPSNKTLKGLFKGDKTFAEKEKSAKEKGLGSGFVAAAMKRLGQK